MALTASALPRRSIASSRDGRPSNVGGVSQYTVYRVAGDALLPGQTWTPVATVAAVPGQNDYAAVDAGQLVNGALYTYFIIATYGDGIQSDPSNLVTIVGVNEPPVAADDAYSVAEDASFNQRRARRACQ